MRLSEADRDRFVEILAANVSATLFADVVREQQVVRDFELLRKQAPEDPTEARRFIARKVVEAYDEVERVWHLARALYRESYRDDRLGPLLVEFVSAPPANPGVAWQGAIAKRANTMAQREFRVFLEENEAKICVVVAACDALKGNRDATLLGTGFLVGPDVVLTAYHTLSRHISQGKIVLPAPGICYALFDYYEGQQLTEPIEVPVGAVKIPFADDWLIDSREAMEKDGLIVKPDDAQLALLPQRLDFALVRLARPVGRQTRSRSGGPRRSWIKLNVATPLTLSNDDRIIITQHPQGNPQQFDLGRYSETDSALDPTGTRLRYTTETDEGTSGAPCFNQRYRLVGMHNAAFKPNTVDVELNQAIRIDSILAALTNIPGTDKESEAVRLWNISSGGEPRVILGRQVLLDWLDSAATEKPARRANRVYAAVVDQKDLAANSAFGKTYTIEILRAARRGTSEPILVLGNDDNVLPDNVSDLIRAFALQLGIRLNVIDEMPRRPAAELPSASPNPDKLRRWASEDVPAWFDEVLKEFRMVDPVAEVKRRIQTLKAGGIAPTPAEEELAAQQGGQLGERWSTAWIVVTGLWKSRLTEEVRDLLAGMIGGRSTEDAVFPQLRRLRWLFIGYVPDFLAVDQVTSELLDPRTIGASEIAAAIRSLSDSLAIEAPPNDAYIIAVIRALLKLQADVARQLKNPVERLPVLQRLFPILRESFVSDAEPGI